MSATYTRPAVTDYGSLTELTAAVDFAGPEDGGNKIELPGFPHHS
jgi:hypothetical protein